MMKNDEFYMEEALRLARGAGCRGEAPIGAVIVRKADGFICGRGSNCREENRSALGHAEIQAIEAACRTLGGWRLSGCVMFVTLEPCPMCAGAIINARLDRVVFGAYDAKNGSAGSVANIFELPFTSVTEVCGGVLSEKCGELMKSFFRGLRGKNRMNGDIKLIPIETDAQIAALADMADEIWHEWFLPIIGEEQIDYMLDRFQSVPAVTKQIRQDGYCYRFIHKGGSHIGYTAFHGEADGRLFLSKIYIKKEHRGNHFATAVINQLKDYCRENGFSAIWLTVNKHNDNSVAVYEKLGFRRFDSVTTDIGGGFVMDDYFYQYDI